RFERLLDEGRELLQAGDPDAAERALSVALELWRGPALADFRFDVFAQVESRRLDELRLEAVSDRIEARLSVGRIAGVIPELEGLVEEPPLRERPRAQLMRALYAAGRQSDALELYRRTRALLMDELGLEPGPELRALEQRILTQDPTLDAPKEAE